MRTRIYNKMTNNEIEAYLNEGKKTIFVAVGTVEAHGDLPVDCETIVVDALAEKIAAVSEGLALINLPFFFPGATATGRGTVNVSIVEGSRYLKNIAMSLWRQGFSRQMYISLHAPAYLTINTMCMDFFNETKVPIAHCDFTHAWELAKKGGWKPEYDLQSTFNDIIYWAYDALGQLDYIPLYPDKQMTTVNPAAEAANKKQYYLHDLSSLAYAPGCFGYYYLDIAQHSFNEACKNKEERKAKAEQGRKVIDSFVSAFQPGKYIEYLQNLDDMLQNEILLKYPWLQKR